MGGTRKRDKLIYWLFERPIRRFIAVSEEVGKVMATVNPRIQKKITVIHNGVKLDTIDSIARHCGNGLPDGLLRARFRIGILGRLTYQKGIDIFLDTASEITKNRNDVAFLIVGDGPLREALEQRAASLGIAACVFFLGLRTDAISLLKLFDVFLFTSKYEPFGLVLTEAMAAGVPIVALQLHGAVSEILQDSVNGSIVSTTDPVALASRVLRLLDDVQLRERFVTCARQQVEEKFTIEENARKVKEVYRQCSAAPVE